MVKDLRQRSGLAWFCACAASCVVFNTGPCTVLPDNSILITANMQSETGFTSSHQLKSYVASKSRLKLAARAVLSADAGLLVPFAIGLVGRRYSNVSTTVQHCDLTSQTDACIRCSLWRTPLPVSRWGRMTANASLNQTQLRCIGRREQFTLYLMCEVNMILILLLATLLKGKKIKTYTAILCQNCWTQYEI